MNKGIRFRIYPNKQQRELLAQTFGSVRLIYNLGLYFLCTNYIQKEYQTLNEEGKLEAGEVFLDFLERLNEVTQNKDFQKRD